MTTTVPSPLNLPPTISRPGHRDDPLGALPRAGTSPLPSVIAVRRWDDALVDRFGFPVQDPYVENVWLPVIGSSATWAIRCLAGWTLAAPGDGVAVPLAELAEALGLSRATASSSSPVQRTIHRLMRFGLVEWTGSTLRVRVVVPAVTARQLERLSPRIRRVHERLIAGRRVA